MIMFPANCFLILAFNDHASYFVSGCEQIFNLFVLRSRSICFARIAVMSEVKTNYIFSINSLKL